MNSKRQIVEDNLAVIGDWEKQKLPLAEVARRLGMKYDTLKKYLNNLGIHYQTNQSRKGLPHKERMTTIDKVLAGNFSNSYKRIRLIKEGLKENKCECCGLSDWMGKPIPLELHHVDFNHYNNSLDNLQILCANCHMQTHNYCNTKK